MGGISIASIALGTLILIVYFIDPHDRGLQPLYSSAAILAGGFVFLASIKKLRQPLYLLVPLSVPLAFFVVNIPELFDYDLCAINPILLYIWSYGMLLGLPLLSYRLVRRYYDRRIIDKGGTKPPPEADLR